jgi:methionyl-tRNA synthetase
VLADNIPANEFLNLEGGKLSKSKGHGILVKDILQEFNPDLIRYTIATNLPENKDADFSWDDFQIKNNNELAAILGNFINRTVVFVKNKFDNKIPERINNKDVEILEYLKKQKNIVSECYENFRFRDALNETMNAVRAANKYFNDAEPWKAIKEDKVKCAEIINNCLQICHSISILIAPILPNTSDKIIKILNKDKSDFSWDKIGEICLKSNTELGENQILFPQLEIKAEEKFVEAITADEITVDDFKKIKLRVAKILECELVPKSKKLVKLKIKVGEKEKQIVAGISEFYKPEELVGKLIIVVDNLKKSKLMGIESHGMLLAGKINGKLKIITVDGEIESGAEVN